MSWKVGHPIKRDGTNQSQRLLDALRPERNPIDARRTEDLLLFLYQITGQFAYYNSRNEVDGDWKVFFDEFGIQEEDTKEEKLLKIREFLSRITEGSRNSTFMAILLSFLRMFRFLQNDINGLTQKHLEFYYEQALRFRRSPPRPDEVHLLFELAPHTDQHRIPTGTALKAGNDEQGRPLVYTTNREIVANKARLAAIKTALITPDGKIYAAEMANSADGLGAPLTGEPAKWPTFGHPDNMQQSMLGLAIASPLLLLREGERIITLRLSFDYEGESPAFSEADLEQFMAYGSGETEWIQLSLALLENIDWEEKKATLVIRARPEQPAIVAYNKNILNGRLNTSSPVLRLLLDPERAVLNNLKAIAIREISLKVEVAANATQPGNRKLVIQNDSGLLDSSSAFLPFGPSPNKGSLFYIGSEEVFSKPLDSLKIRFQWAGLPDSYNGFAAYYDTGNEKPGYIYDRKYQENDAYKVAPQLLKGKAWKSIGNYQKLFELAGGHLSNIRIFELKHSGLKTLPLVEKLPKFEELDTEINQGFLRLSLNQDFGHQAYSKLFAKIAGTSGNLPNLPYTPKLQSISLGYTASQNISLSQKGPNVRFFHILPFGSQEHSSGGKAQLLPQLPRASLYLGFEGFEPGQNLHLLFQLAEGSAAAVETISPEDIEWNYLTAQGWRHSPLSGGEIFIDTTLGLQKSGIVALAVGTDTAMDTSLLPGGLHWLRASIGKDPAGATQSIAIHAQAVTAVFQDNNNGPNHLLHPLAAHSISALVEQDSAIQKVEQPYASFGGVPAEQDDRFYARVSERLRHKQRAATLWDIERLLLQRFPNLYEVKAIPHTGFDEKGSYSEFQPGQVTIVLIPQLRNQNAVNPLQPRASVALLAEAGRFLLPLCPPFIGAAGHSLHVINPRYEPIQVSCKIGFREGYDGGCYAERLNEALRRKLSRWAYEEGEDIRFGGSVYKSQLLAFAEEQEYVDYLTNFKMLHGNAGPSIGEMSVNVDFKIRNIVVGEDKDIAAASTSASILVSADRHLIEVLQPGQFPCTEPDICQQGIGCWYIDMDFIVS